MRTTYLPHLFRRAAAALLLLLACALPAGAGEVLRVLAWPGYADPVSVKAFEHATGARVELTLVDSDDVLWAKISANGGADFDVFAANTAEMVRYIDNGLVAPIDTRNIANIKRQLPRFRDTKNVPGIMRGDKLYAVPYTYADMGLIYDRKAFPVPPTSIASLWDPKFRGRVIAYDGGTHNFSLALLKNGARNPFQVPANDWRKLASDLIALRRNVYGFYTKPDESLRMYREGKAVLLFANYGSQQVQEFKTAGLDVGYVIPREGALAWLDCWAIVAASQQRALAEKWINFMLDPQVSDLLVTRQGLSSTLKAGAAHAGSTLHWLQPPEDVDRRSQLWKRIVSGDRIERVMAE